MLNIGNLLTLHVFLGMLLLGPGQPEDRVHALAFHQVLHRLGGLRAEGPPAPLQRVTEQFVILTTVAVLGTGVMLVLEGPGNGSWARLHHLSFFLWAVVVVIHLASYVPKLPRCCRTGLTTPTSCWRPGPRAGCCCAVPSSPGLGLAFATYHLSAKFGGSHSIIP